MSDEKLAEFLATDVDGAFEFERCLWDADEPPSRELLYGLKRMLSEFEPEEHEIEGSVDWAHLVAGLMIGRDWDPDGFAAVAAPFLRSRAIAVWTAAQRLLLDVSSLDRMTFDAIEACAAECPYEQEELVARLRGRIAL